MLISQGKGAKNQVASKYLGSPSQAGKPKITKYSAATPPLPESTLQKSCQKCKNPLRSPAPTLRQATRVQERRQIRGPSALFLFSSWRWPCGWALNSLRI